MTTWIDKSETIEALSAALVKALGDIEDVTKGRTANAGSYSYSYADLGDVLRGARPALVANGLAVTQAAEVDGDDVVVWTTLLHSSGQFVTYAPMRLPAGKTAQNTGSAVTYARRYSLLAVLGMATEDDDGASASPRVERVHRVEAKPKKAAGPRSEEESEIRSILASVPAQASSIIRGRFKAQFGCGLSELDPSRHAEALDWIVGAVSEWEHDHAATVE